MNFVNCVFGFEKESKQACKGSPFIQLINDRKINFSVFCYTWPHCFSKREIWYKLLTMVKQNCQCIFCCWIMIFLWWCNLLRDLKKATQNVTKLLSVISVVLRDIHLLSFSASGTSICIGDCTVGRWVTKYKCVFFI